MTTTTEFSSNFFLTYMEADSLDDLATAPLGDFVDDFDTEKLADLILDRINQVTRDYGVLVTSSGIAYCEYGADIDVDGMTDALGDILDSDEMAHLQKQCEIDR